MADNSTMYSGAAIEVSHSTRQLPEGKRSPWETASFPGRRTAAVVLGFSKKHDSYILIENYRPSLDRWNIEIAGGLAHDGETPGATARREFEEETGWKVTRLKYLQTYYPLPGCGSFPIACFLADVTQSARPRRDAGEFVKVRIVRRNRIRTLLNRNASRIEPVTLCVLNGILDPLTRRSSAKTNRLAPPFVD